ncbi:MAG: hypothetical protein DCC55_05090 [Chloroflexi bacterium]|nr:MAG: hypothetical protein DCC55_05090 [Chloroflexota bacterium]
MLHIRPATPADLPLLAQHLHLWGPTDYHDQRLAEQASGLSLWLITWEDALPVGHLQLVRQGLIQTTVQAHIRDCPQLEAIGVAPECRAQGIGRTLIRAAEELIDARGDRQSGLSVSVANPDSPGADRAPGLSGLATRPLCSIPLCSIPWRG